MEQVVNVLLMRVVWHLHVLFQVRPSWLSLVHLADLADFCGGSYAFLQQIFRNCAGFGGFLIFATYFMKCYGFCIILRYFFWILQISVGFPQFCGFFEISRILRNFADCPARFFSCLLIRGRIACGCCRSLWMSSCMSRMLTACAPTKSPIKRDLQHRGQQISKLTVIYCALYFAGLQWNSIMKNVYPAVGVYCWDNFL